MKIKTKLIHGQRGSFAIELAFVLVGLCAIFLFTTDLSHKLLIRAKLDRSSFALSNVIKERTRYFDGDFVTGQNLNVSSSDLEDLSLVAARMLNTEPDNVALQIESMVDESVTPFRTERFDTLGCSVNEFDSYADLAPKDGAVTYPIYRVSLCEAHESWFEAFWGDSSTITIVSSSIMPGR